MRKTLLFLVAFTFYLKTDAQTIEASTTIPTNEYLDLVAANLEIPEEILKLYQNSSLELTFILTITKDGSVFNPKVQNDSLQLESFLKKAFQNLPKWNPKTEDGVAVVSRKAFNLLIPIVAQEQKKEMVSEAISENKKKNFTRQLSKNLNLNYVNLDANISEIKMIATIIVEKDGSLNNIKIVDSNVPSINNDVIRFIKSMPKWQPATENGVPIRSDFRLPIKINVKN